jgi:hypothetical protein
MKKGLAMGNLIELLNSILRGWAEYYRIRRESWAFPETL